MKINLSTIFWVVALTVASVATASDQADLISARAEYLSALSDARLAGSRVMLDQAEMELKRAQVEKTEAEVDLLRAKVEHLTTYTQMLKEEYDRIRREEATVKYRMYEVRLNQNLCAPLADGETNRQVFQCLKFFRRYLVTYQLQKKLLFDDVVDPLSAEEFIPHYSTDVSLEFPGGNLGNLLVFADQHDLSFAPYGKAHGFVMGFLDAIAVAAQTRIQEYRIYLDAIRAGTLDVFKLPSL